MKKKEMMTSEQNGIWTLIRSYFNILPDKEEEEATLQYIASGVVFKGANLWVLIFAIFIASLGLNVNSTAVIIGAMLISPLMGPIIGMGLGIGINDLGLLKTALKNYLVATGISVLTATLYFLITPLDEAQSELLARTSPTLYDVLIALCGGLAGIVAIATKGKGNVIPGVAIATALMPPLCTAGYGLAMGNLYYFFGAFYLFFINTVFICLATYIGVRMMKFQKKQFVDRQRFDKVRKYIVAVVVATMLPATFMTVGIIRRSIFNTNVNRFLKTEMTFAGTQMISHDVDEEKKVVNVAVVGKEVTAQQIAFVEDRMGNYGLQDYKLKLIQGTQSDSVLVLNSRLNNISQSNNVNTQKLLQQSTKIRNLEEKVNEYEELLATPQVLRSELNVLFPTVKSLGMGTMSIAQMTRDSSATMVVAVVEAQQKTKGATLDVKRLHDWLQQRLKIDSLQVIVK